MIGGKTLSTVSGQRVADRLTMIMTIATYYCGITGLVVIVAD